VFGSVDGGGHVGVGVSAAWVMVLFTTPPKYAGSADPCYADTRPPTCSTRSALARLAATFHCYKDEARHRLLLVLDLDLQPRHSVMHVSTGNPWIHTCSTEGSSWPMQISDSYRTRFPNPTISQNTEFPNHGSFLPMLPAERRRLCEPIFPPILNRRSTTLSQPSPRCYYRFCRPHCSRSIQVRLRHYSPGFHS
jgi:hypothetical protein